MSREFVSARKLSSLDSRKVPELTEEFPEHESQKPEIREIFNSWRRERDSNHESASPYPFEISIEFSQVGTRGIRGLRKSGCRDVSSNATQAVRFLDEKPRGRSADKLFGRVLGNTAGRRVDPAEAGVFEGRSPAGLKPDEFECAHKRL